MSDGGGEIEFSLAPEARTLVAQQASAMLTQVQSANRGW
jgi:hypothetical protein